MTASSRSRWTSSGKARPCSVCGRNIDNKCRWNETTIACYQGQRFAPPSGLVVGDVLDIDERRWAVTSLNGGFSGAAVIFRPHIDRRDFTPSQKKRRANEKAELIPTLHRLFAECRQLVQDCLGMPELEFLTAPEIQSELDHARATFNSIIVLHREMTKARREEPDFNRFVKALEIWLKQTSYQLRDVETFMRVHLGTPTPELIASLRAGR